MSGLSVLLAVSLSIGCADEVSNPKDDAGWTIVPGSDAWELVATSTTRVSKISPPLEFPQSDSLLERAPRVRVQAVEGGAVVWELFLSHETGAAVRASSVTLAKAPKVVRSWRTGLPWQFVANSAHGSHDLTAVGVLETSQGTPGPPQCMVFHADTGDVKLLNSNALQQSRVTDLIAAKDLMFVGGASKSPSHQHSASVIKLDSGGRLIWRADGLHPRGHCTLAMPGDGSSVVCAGLSRSATSVHAESVRVHRLSPSGAIQKSTSRPAAMFEPSLLAERFYSVTAVATAANGHVWVAGLQPSLMTHRWWLIQLDDKLNETRRFYTAFGHETKSPVRAATAEVLQGVFLAGAYAQHPPKPTRTHSDVHAFGVLTAKSSVVDPALRIGRNPTVDISIGTPSIPGTAWIVAGDRSSTWAIAAPIESK